MARGQVAAMIAQEKELQMDYDQSARLASDWDPGCTVSMATRCRASQTCLNASLVAESDAHVAAAAFVHLCGPKAHHSRNSLVIADKRVNGEMFRADGDAAWAVTRSNAIRTRVPFEMRRGPCTH